MTGMACHVSGRHLGTVHSGGGAEEWCVYDSTDEYTASQLIGKIGDPVHSNSSWDSRDTLDFAEAASVSGTDGDCEDVEITQTEITITVVDSLNGTPCPPEEPTGCARPAGVETSHSGHSNYTQFNIWLKATLFTYTLPSLRGLINHEVGHTVGFDDPVVEKTVRTDVKGCWVLTAPGRSAPVWSIMHHVCASVPLLEWPSSGDFIVFDTQVQ
jgi:hypothetical protein